MRAVRYHGREDVRVDDVPEPVCGNGQVKVCQTIKPPSGTKGFSF
jgi:threonine dehydrogenase-like Zn-dependent dehydrogenase